MVTICRRSLIDSTIGPLYSMRPLVSNVPAYSLLRILPGAVMAITLMLGLVSILLKEVQVRTLWSLVRVPPLGRTLQIFSRPIILSPRVRRAR